MILGPFKPSRPMTINHILHGPSDCIGITSSRGRPLPLGVHEYPLREPVTMQAGERWVVDVDEDGFATAFKVEEAAG